MQTLTPSQKRRAGIEASVRTMLRATPDAAAEAILYSHLPNRRKRVTRAEFSAALRGMVDRGEISMVSLIIPDRPCAKGTSTFAGKGFARPHIGAVGYELRKGRRAS